MVMGAYKPSTKNVKKHESLELADNTHHIKLPPKFYLYTEN